jgi:hypothetical protein
VEEVYAWGMHADGPCLERSSLRISTSVRRAVRVFSLSAASSRRARSSSAALLDSFAHTASCDSSAFTYATHR